MGKFVALFLLACSLTNVIGQEIVPSKVVSEHQSFARFEQYAVFSGTSRNDLILPEEVTEYNLLQLDRAALQKLVANADANISFKVPVSDREELELQLVENSLEGLIIRESDGNRQVKFNPGRHYQASSKADRDLW